MAEIRIKQAADGIDAAHLADCVASPGYALIRARMARQRQQYVDALIQADELAEVKLLQGQIAAVDRSLDLPDILRREMAARRKTDG